MFIVVQLCSWLNLFIGTPTMPSIQQKVIRLGFGLTERFSTGLAGRLAFRLFCRTPSSRPTSEKARRALADAAPVMARAEHVTLATSSGTVACYRFAPIAGEPSETVFVVHGWGSRTEHMLPIIEALRAAGRAVVAIDLPGHGASSGRKLNMAIAVEAVDAAWRQFGPLRDDDRTFVRRGGDRQCGGRIGCARARARKPDRLLTISAPNSLPDFFNQFADWVGLSGGGRNVLFSEVGRVTGSPLSDFVSARQIAEIGVPTLVIHAHDDKEVPVDNAYRLVGAGPHVQVFWADGYGHRRILAGRDVAQVIVDFADQQTGTDTKPGTEAFAPKADTVTHS